MRSAVEITNRNWWPHPTLRSYKWPEGALRDGSVEAFLDGYSRFGFERCDDPTLEPGYLKIAIYITAAGSPKHVARQLPDGRWASKLGDGMDIYHSKLGDVAGGGYGNPEVYMRRPVTSSEQPQEAGLSDASSSVGEPPSSS